MSRLVHISDLHLPADNHDQAAKLCAVINSLQPDLLVVSGDLTRRGSLEEYRAAADFMQKLPVPAMVLAGNHDIPYFNLLLRLFFPLKRMAGHFPKSYNYTGKDFVVAPLDTARGMQWRLDWSLGVVSETQIAAITRWLRTEDGFKWRIVVSHHPLAPDLADPYRSKTAHASTALQHLVENGADIFLHGHLHRHRIEPLQITGRNILIIGASTALGDRERGQPSGFNVLDFSDSQLAISPYIWQKGDFSPSSTRYFSRST